MPGVWLDVDVGKEGHPPDIKTAFKLIRECVPLWPTLIVCSGGGFHPYWLLHEPMQSDQARDVLTRWGKAMPARFDDREYNLDSVFDLSRVMRVPGSRNHKPEVDKPCFIFGDYGCLYNIEDLEPYLNIEVQFLTKYSSRK